MPSDAITPASPAATQAAAGGPVTVKVVTGGEALPDLPDGATLETQATARAAKGVIEMTTADGKTVQVKVQGAVQLPPVPPGATLLLQVQNAKGGELTLQLLAINGRALGGITLPQLQTALHAPQLAGAADLGGLLNPGRAAQPQGGSPVNPQGLPQVLPGTAAAPLGLTATMIRAAVQPTGPAQPGQDRGGNTGGFSGGFSGQTGGLPFGLAAGTTVTMRIAAIGPQPGGVDPGTGDLPQQQPPAGSPALPGQPAIIAPRPGLPPHAGTATPPAPATPALPTPTPAPSPAVLLSGSVLSAPPNGQAIIQTPVGTFSILSPGDLAPGTPLVLEVVGKPVPPAATTGAAATPPPGLTADGWPALSQALDTLGATGQTQALEQLLRAIPQANPRLAASVAAFAGALRNNDTKALTPETALRGLEKAGKKDVAQRLKGDLEALAEQSSRPVGGGEWRAYTMPFLNGGAIDPIRLFVRQGGGDGKGGKGGGTGNDQRFVVDLNLSQLGRLQLDGLVRREDKLFDLIIRTGEALSQQMRHDILGIFAGASELVGTKGSVSFQAGGRWMEFPPAPPEPTRLEV